MSYLRPQKVNCEAYTVRGSIWKHRVENLQRVTLGAAQLRD
jgi:hypothetical protein